MPQFINLLCLLSLASLASARLVERDTTRAPGFGSPRAVVVEKQPQDAAQLDINKLITVAKTIDQAAGAEDGAPPSTDVPETVITAVDGSITSAGSGTDGLLQAMHGDTPPDLSTGSVLQRRAIAVGDYDQVFVGTGTGPNDRDASINGIGYLTYTVLSNGTYDINACLNFCDLIGPCIFVNLYYEFNNVLTDPNGHPSNLKCAAYSEVHSAIEKTNFGGQTLIPGLGPTYIQQSGGWALRSPPAPATPDGYDLVFGPVNALTSSPQALNSVNLNTYDVQACANLCTRQAADPRFGLCKFFNIYRISNDGIPSTYACNVFALVTGEEHLVSPNGIVIRDSRGYARTNFLVDGGFEAYADCDWFCFTEHTANWDGITNTTVGFMDATVFYYETYAYVGHSVGLLGSAYANEYYPGTLQSKHAIQTIPGKSYVVSFFVDNTFSGAQFEVDAWHEVMWNGVAAQTWQAGYHDWKHYQTTVVGTGNDIFGIHGGKAPAYSFIDEIYIFQL
ncbi:hypothetical protein BDN72DRAFT_827999 [Pluteus cervinus]|uniref:Uncharacterized protein n=1 Tax=Pluteus cervinus TaxID=181527 RepID=A0ACD3A887_9AGAR|nr:hypothetical protein BDN72DRAFT_827999 [Pluteus cervinus]